jgi:hypothetical protein
MQRLSAALDYLELLNFSGEKCRDAGRKTVLKFGISQAKLAAGHLARLRDPKRAVALLARYAAALPSFSIDRLNDDVAELERDLRVSSVDLRAICEKHLDLARAELARRLK